MHTFFPDLHHRFRALWSAAFVGAILTSLAANAQETILRQVFDTRTDTHVEVVALFSQPSRGGYLPVRVKIANNLDNTRGVRLSFTSSSGFYGGGTETRSSFEFAAPAGKSVVTDIMVPVSSGSSRGFGDAMVTLRLSGSFGDSNGNLMGQIPEDLPGVLLSRRLHTPNSSMLDAEIRGMSSYRGSGVFAGNFDPKQLPDEWLAFSGYDSVLMTDTDWSEVPAGARNAILSWLRLGGQLVIYAAGNPTLSSLGIPEHHGHGSCRVMQIGPGLKLDPSKTVQLVSGSSNPVQPIHASIKDNFRTSWPLQDHFGTRPFDYHLLVAVLIVFSVLVGPLNLFVFAKSGQRHRLFVTTPLISVVTSLVLIAMIILQDGFGGNGIRRVLMEIDPDPDRNAAYVHQEQFSRCGILTSSAFGVDPACFFAPVPIAKSRWARYTGDRNSSSSFGLQPSGGKLTASGDWWQSRSEHGHVLAAVVSTRGRIEQADEPDTMVSTFDFPIESLYFLDSERKWRHAKDIHTGKPFQLLPVADSEVTSVLSRQAAAYSGRNNAMLNRAITRPGHFVAITGKAPGIDTHKSIRWNETRTVITGAVRPKS